MKKIALIYSFNSVKTATVAKKIEKLFSQGDIELVNAEDIDEKKFLSYDNYIIGVPTWFDGELPNYWDEFVPAIEDMDLSGKKFAIYGLGDQVGYPENFCDGIGIMAKLLKERNADIIGSFPTVDYNFEHSKAVVNKKFVGLPLDQENQPRLTGKRIEQWVNVIKKLF
jgi:flavodoxin I